MKKLDQKGVTIIEAMIVLAIIALVFSITFSVFQRYLAEKTFQNGVTLLQEEFNGFLNDVRQNTYPTRKGIKCTENISTPNISALTFQADPAVLIGHSDICVFLGKAIQLGIRENTPAGPRDKIISKDEHYVIHTLIGPRKGNESNANIYQTFRDYSGSYNFDSTSIEEIPHGGLIEYAYFEDATLPSPHRVYLDGFAVILDNFGAKTGPDQSIFLGGGRVIALKVIYKDLDKTNTGRDRYTVEEFAEETYKQFVPITPPNPPNHPAFYQDFEGAITICLASGKGERKAYIEIGSRSGFLKAIAVLEPQSDVNAKCPP